MGINVKLRHDPLPNNRNKIRKPRCNHAAAVLHSVANPSGTQCKAVDSLVCRSLRSRSQESE